MGQYIQEGLRIIFETFINIEKPRKNLEIKSEEGNLDGLNFLAGKTVDFVNKQAFKGTVLAHNDGGVPCIVVKCSRSKSLLFWIFSLFIWKSLWNKWIHFRSKSI